MRLLNYSDVHWHDGAHGDAGTRRLALFLTKLRALLLACISDLQLRGTGTALSSPHSNPGIAPKTFPSLPRGPTSTGAFNTTDLALYRREVNFSLTSKNDLKTLNRAKSICPF